MMRPRPEPRVNYSSVGALPINPATRSPRLLPGENRTHAFGDRQLDVEPVREVTEDRRGCQALDRLADLRRLPAPA